MISFFPKPYEDELLYSVFARYYAHSGYGAYSCVAQDLYKKELSPSIEFLGNLTDDAIKNLNQNKSLKEIAENHTLLPFYLRFLSKERKKAIWGTIIKEDGKCINHYLIGSQKVDQRHLRYCPQCAICDREKNGEAYYHRIHQLIGITVCPIHFCKLIDTDVKMIGNVDRTFIPLEEFLVDEIEAVQESDSELENRISEFIADIFHLKLDLDLDFSARDFFTYHLIGTPYLSIRGGRKNPSLLLKEFTEYYKNYKLPHISTWNQIEKILQGKRINTYEVCLLCLFLGLTAEDIGNWNPSKINPTKDYDDKILELHKEGYNYAQIARMIGGSYDYVKRIGEGNREKYFKKNCI